jgi:acetyl-CoA carboxylase, biotin carboxylase subunit
VWDADRPAAIERALRARGELELRGVATTRDVARDVLSSPEFRSGNYHTGFLAEAEGRLPALAVR